MPRLLARNTVVEAGLKETVRALVRREMEDKGFTYRDLAERLNSVGLLENERNLRNKVGRGELSAALLLACLRVIGTDVVRIQEVANIQMPTEETLYWTLDRALEDDLITVLRRDDQNGEYVIRVGDWKTPITVRLLANPNSFFEYRLSHLVRIPELGGELAFPSPWNVTPGLALHTAIERLGNIYRAAIDAGHKPREDWLIPYDLSKRLPQGR